MRKIVPQSVVIWVFSPFTALTTQDCSEALPNNEDI